MKLLHLDFHAKFFLRQKKKKNYQLHKKHKLKRYPAKLGRNRNTIPIYEC